MRSRGRTILVTILVAVLAVAAWRRAPVASAPVAVVLSDWHVTVSVADNEPKIRLETAGMVLRSSRKTPTQIPLFPRDTVFEDLRINGKPVAPLRRDGWFWAEMPRRGEFSMTARLTVKPEFDRGEYTLRLRKPSCVRCRVTLDSDEALEAWLSGMPQRVVGTAVAGTHGELVASRMDSLQLVWREPIPEVTRRGTATIRPSIACTVGDRVIEASVHLDVDIVGGSTDRMTLRLPPAAEKVKLSGPHVRDVRHAATGTDVFFSGLIAGSTQLRLSFIVARTDSPLVACPELAVTDGRVDGGGWVMVSRAATGILLEDSRKGYEEASTLDVPPQILGLATGKPAFVYRRTVRDAKLVLDHVRAELFPLVETIADRADMLTVVRPGGEEITRIRYRVRNNAKQFLRLALPEGTRLLRAEVEGKRCSVARQGTVLLVPLAKSIQTRTGLVPFPVEVIYCRQAGAMKKGTWRRLDLPEVHDVPVAVVTATVLCPEDTQLAGYRSTLKRVNAFTLKDDAWFLAPTQEEPETDPDTASPASLSGLLARNYYSVGYEAYRENRFEDAETFLAKAVQLDPAGPTRADADQLLDNIKLGRGDVGGADRMERAKIAKIQQTISAYNPEMVSWQNALIKSGLEKVEAGEEELGAELLQEAARLEKKLAQRSDSAARQRALGRQYKGKLSKVTESRSLNARLKERLRTLQDKVRLLTKGSGGREKETKKAQFASALNRAARRKDVDIAEGQKAAFGDVLREVEQDPGPQLTQSAYARQYQEKTKRGQTFALAQPQPAQSLDNRNAYLSQQVEILEQALAEAEVAEAQAHAERIRKEEVAQISQQIKQAWGKVEKLKDRVNEGGQAANMYDVDVAPRLQRLREWTYGNNEAYGALDPSLKQQFAELESNIRDAQRAVKQARQKRLAASNVVVDVNDIIGGDARGNSRALADFIGANYIAQVDQGRQQYEIANGTLAILNTNENPDLLNDVVVNLRRNDGQVVTVAGCQFALPKVSESGILQDAFASATGDGRKYAILDEAQYRTVLSAEAGAARDNGGSRQVVVGTPNTVAEESFLVAQSDANWNGLVIGGTEISVPHDKYLAIDNGAYVSILKASKTQDWQEEAVAIDMEPSVPYRLEVPEVGSPIYFEKMLLGAGESPDVEMNI